ncbi:MAG: hypothetical protein M1358_20165 [Chloroflexi bacterium]|nr:hypothetical protein [Chloroflexota bacterium]
MQRGNNFADKREPRVGNRGVKDWLGPHLLAAVVIVIALLIGGTWLSPSSRRQSLGPQTPFTSSESPTSTPSQRQAVWDVPEATVPQSEAHKLKEALRLKRIASDDTYVRVTGATVAGNWAVLDGKEQTETTQLVQPTGILEVLAQRSETGWQIIAPADPEFCETLARVPDSIISKDYYVGCRSQ